MTFSLSLYRYSHQASTPPLTNFFTDPLYFLTAYKMMSRPSVLAGASDSKNPDPYYLPVTQNSDVLCPDFIYFSIILVA